MEHRKLQEKNMKHKKILIIVKIGCNLKIDKETKERKKMREKKRQRKIKRKLWRWKEIKKDNDWIFKIKKYILLY